MRQNATELGVKEDTTRKGIPGTGPGYLSTLPDLRGRRKSTTQQGHLLLGKAVNVVTEDVCIGLLAPGPEEKLLLHLVLQLLLFILLYNHCSHHHHCHQLILTSYIY